MKISKNNRKAKRELIQLLVHTMHYGNIETPKAKSLDTVIKTICKDAFKITRLIRSYNKAIREMSEEEFHAFNIKLNMDCVPEAFSKYSKILLDEYHESKK
jgi:hypothetical protein